MSTVVPSQPLTEETQIVQDKKHECAFCNRKFKTADKILIEEKTENRYHQKCWADGKDRLRPTFFGLYGGNSPKISSVDRARIQSRLKKIRRQVKKGQKA